MMVLFASDSNFINLVVWAVKFHQSRNLLSVNTTISVKKFKIGKCTKLLVQDGLIADPVSFARSKAG